MSITPFFERSAFAFVFFLLTMLFGCFTFSAALYELTHDTSPLFLVRSLYRVPFYLARPIDDFNTCADLLRSDPARLGRVRIKRATRVHREAFPQPECFLADLTPDDLVLLDRYHPGAMGYPLTSTNTHREITFKAHDRILHSGHALIPVSYCRYRGDSNLPGPTEGVAQPFMDEQGRVRVAIDTFIEKKLLIMEVTLFWGFALSGLGLLFAFRRSRHDDLHTRNLTHEAEALRIVTEWSARGRIENNSLNTFCRLINEMEPVRVEIIINTLATETLLLLTTEDNTLPASGLIATASLLNRRMGKKALPHLRMLYEQHASWNAMKNLLLKILELFESSGDRRLSRFLVRYLDQDDSDIIIGVIKALATCGTVQAVESIYRVGRESMNPFVRTAAKDAIDAIQARLGTADVGWLSLPVEPGLDGALSTPDVDRAGSLSHTATSRKKEKQTAP